MTADVAKRQRVEDNGVNGRHDETAPTVKSSVSHQAPQVGGDDAWRKNIRDPEGFTSGPNGERPDWFFTGPQPVPGSAGMQPNGTITSLPLPDLSTCTRQEALAYFDNTWLLSEVLFSGLQGEEAFYRPPAHKLRHPLIFYYGHPAAFYVNKLRVAGIVSEPVNAYFEQIFETGVDEMSWDDLSKNEMDWPSVREVTEYRRCVYRLVREAIQRTPEFDALPITWASRAWALFMGFEHERIHIETSSVLFRELPLRLLRAPPQWPPPHTSACDAARAPPANDLVAVPEGRAVLGKPADMPSFGWDNEYGVRAFQVPAFSAMRALVSNSEFLSFVRGGGYSDRRWWTDAGWQWRTFRNAKRPIFWMPDGPAGLHRYRLRLMWEEVALPPALPAVVNRHEASAYAAWLSAQQGLQGHAAYRLLTEPEHHRLRQAGPTDSAGRPATDAVMANSGADFRGTANRNLAHGSEAAVDAAPPTPAGFRDVHGNLWQWCEDSMACLPGNRGVHPFYDDFSTPCYDGEHAVILGGSFISTGSEASVFARFHFRPHFFQHAGFRLVSGTAPPLTSCADSPPPHVRGWDPSTRRTAEQSATRAAGALHRALLLHYATPEQQLAGAARALPAALLPLGRYAERAAALLADTAERLGTPTRDALEVGCSVGGISFQLARTFGRVLGVDGDAAAVAAALQAQAGGSIAIRRKDEGRLVSELQLPAGADAAARGRVSFRHMDPACLAPDLGQFDGVLLTCVLEASPSPGSLLGRMSSARGLVRPGGLLAVLSTWCWSEQAADPALWLGGTTDAAGMPQRSQEGLATALGGEFELVGEADVPHVLRQCERRYTLSVPQASVWRRRPVQ